LTWNLGFIRTFDLSPFYVTSSVCTVNRDPPSNFTIVPPSSRPVQGKRPEVASEHLDPSSWKVASGLFSHQISQITPQLLALFSTHFRTSVLSYLRISILNGSRHCSTFLFQILLYAFTDHRPLTGIYVSGLPLFHTVSHTPDATGDSSTLITTVEVPTPIQCEPEDRINK
jgi:hypothetical protein